MDRLRTMESFVRVARSGSFTTAASQLGISRALVSRHVTDLERRLGVRLLNRSTRWLNLTERGQSYLEVCEQLLGNLETSERAIAREQDEAAGTLKVVAPKSFGSLNLADAVIAFARAHPRMRVLLTLDDYAFLPYDFVERGFDLAIRSAITRDSALLSRQVAKLEWIVCAAPQYLARNGPPQTPSDLLQHACIAHFHPQSMERDWVFDGPGGRRSIVFEGVFVTNSALVARKAALGGLGIALLPRYAVADDLASGALVQMLKRYRIPTRLVLAVYPRTVAAPQRVRLLVDFLIDWFARSDPNRAALPPDGRAAHDRLAGSPRRAVTRPSSSPASASARRSR
jgi:DNA-binding transcriptional LysR family regulator